MTNDIYFVVMLLSYGIAMLILFFYLMREDVKELEALEKRFKKAPDTKMI